jgi:hypothetical protein
MTLAPQMFTTYLGANAQRGREYQAPLHRYHCGRTLACDEVAEMRGDPV